MKKVEKTRNEIIKAFWSLFKEVGLEKITVKNISQRTNINRSTFYNYFFDINDLTTQVEDEIIENTKKDALRIFGDSNQETAISLSIFFTEIFPKSNDKIFLLLSSKGDPSFMSRIKKEIIPLACSLNILDESTPNFEYVVSYIFSAFFGLITYWYESGKNISIDEFTKLAQTLVTTGTFGIAKI